MFEKEQEEWTWQLEFDEAEMLKRKARSREFVLPRSGLKFMDDHFGPRPGCIHTLLGSTGRGKSTLVQSLILEWGKSTNILLYLSEESIDRIELKLFEKEKDAGYLSTKLHLIHEQELLKGIEADNHAGFLRAINAKVQSSQAKILIIDNITTSAFYDGNFKSVMPILAGLRAIAEKHQIPIFLICHTRKGINEHSGNLIQPDDVRGSATLGLTSDYFYTFYRYRKTTLSGATLDGTFIYVGKSRDHESQDRVYRLDYDIGKKRYIKDSQVNFEAFKQFAKEKDKM